MDEEGKYIDCAFIDFWCISSWCDFISDEEYDEEDELVPRKIESFRDISVWMESNPFCPFKGLLRISLNGFFRIFCEDMNVSVFCFVFSIELFTTAPPAALSLATLFLESSCVNKIYCPDLHMSFEEWVERGSSIGLFEEIIFCSEEDNEGCDRIFFEACISKTHSKPRAFSSSIPFLIIDFPLEEFYKGRTNSS